MPLPATLLTRSQQQRSQNGSQSDEAYEILKEKIITLELPPASLLNEADLMEALGFGRTPIREALKQLSYENLVVIFPRQGTIVADVNVSDLQKIFEIRLELEICAARLAAERATDVQIAAMEALFADATATIQAGDTRQLISLDHAAHQLIAQAAQNEFLEEMLEQLYTHVLRVWYVSLHKVGRLADAVAEHKELIVAIKAHDSARAVEIMQAHIEGFQTEFLSVL